MISRETDAIPFILFFPLNAFVTLLSKDAPGVPESLMAILRYGPYKTEEELFAEVNFFSFFQHITPPPDRENTGSDRHTHHHLQSSEGKSWGEPSRAIRVCNRYRPTRYLDKTRCASGKGDPLPTKSRLRWHRYPVRLFSQGNLTPPLPHLCHLLLLPPRNNELV